LSDQKKAFPTGKAFLLALGHFIQCNSLLHPGFEGKQVFRGFFTVFGTAALHSSTPHFE
jgi:hypothetical protein